MKRAKTRWLRSEVVSRIQRAREATTRSRRRMERVVNKDLAEVITITEGPSLERGGDG